MCTTAVLETKSLTSELREITPTTAFGFTSFAWCRDKKALEEKKAAKKAAKDGGK